MSFGRNTERKKRDIVAAGWVQLMTSRKGSCQYQRIRNIEKKTALHIFITLP